MDLNKSEMNKIRLICGVAFVSLGLIYSLFMKGEDARPIILACTGFIFLSTYQPIK